MPDARLPIRSVRGNLVTVSATDVWAVFAIRLRSYQTEPARRKGALVAELEAFAKAADADFQILRVYRAVDADAYARRLRKDPPPGTHREELNVYLEEQRKALARLKSWTPSTFLCVSLSEPMGDFQARASRAFERTPGEVWRMMRQRGSLSDKELWERATAMSARVRDLLGARPATPEEIQWLIRRSFRRGLPEGERATSGGISDAAHWFAEDRVEHRHRHLRIDGEEGESWQAGLVLGEMDDADLFSRAAELMFTPLEDHGFPIDAALSLRWVSSEEAKRRLKHRFRRTANQLREEEMTEHGALGESHERAERAREFVDRIAALQEPLLMGSLSFMVSAQSHSELNARVAALKRSYPWDLHRPFGDQLDVWLQHFPGQRSRVRGFDRPYTPEQIGAMVPHATHDAGSKTKSAFYLAHSARGRAPVFLDLREGSGTNRPPTIALLGTLGGGKTIALQVLLWQAFLYGARIVDVDPKGDHRFHLLPEVASHVRRTVLGASLEFAGMLDPLRIAPDTERHDAAATFLIDVLPRVDGEVETAINGAITRVLADHGQRACCHEVIHVLLASDNEDERKAGRMLASYANGGISQLGFARLSDPLPDLASEQVTYLQVRALKRADVKTVRSEMSQSQRHGRAVLQLVALYAMKILGEDRRRMKVVAFDEASFLAQDAVGQQLLDTLARWARSELATPILSSQLLGDVADQDNLIGHWFAFSMRSRVHARKMLEAMELDADGPLSIAMTERFGEGRALYRDLHGRCEEIQIDVDSRLLRALSTNPDDEHPEDEEESLARLAAVAE